MRIVVQRVSGARVTVGGEEVGGIGPGMVVLVGVGEGDNESQAEWLAEKCANLRIFDDEEGRMNCSLLETDGHALVVSQFTLLATCSKGRRPEFTRAEAPERAEALVEKFASCLQKRGIFVATGRFGARMEVDLSNDGPVTLVIDR